MSSTILVRDVYNTFDFQRLSGKSTMSKRPFYDLLPTIERQTPSNVLCRFAEAPGSELKFLSVVLQVSDTMVIFLKFCSR